MTASPRVSVITIFLDAERYLVEAIESVLGQSYSGWELLLVDDGSTDGSTAIAKDYAARQPGRVRFLEHPGHANRGMSASRNLGLREAAGEFVAFIDADDVWLPRKLEEQLVIMDARPELGMVCGAVNYWYSWSGGEDVVIPTGHVQDRIVPPPEAAFALYPLGGAAAACPSDIMVRTSLARQIGGFEEHFTGERQLYEDQAFFAKIYQAATVLYSSRVWLNYRQRPESCVASVKEAGRYHAVRQYFLTWLKGYLAARPAVEPRVKIALDRALWRYDHPHLHRCLTLPAGLRPYLSKARRKLRSSIRAAAPSASR